MVMMTRRKKMEAKKRMSISDRWNTKSLRLSLFGRGIRDAQSCIDIKTGIFLFTCLY